MRPVFTGLLGGQVPRRGVLTGWVWGLDVDWGACPPDGSSTVPGVPSAPSERTSKTALLAVAGSAFGHRPGPPPNHPWPFASIWGTTCANDRIERRSRE
jgi:hypothetical protein